MATPTYVPLSTITLGSDDALVTFSSLDTLAADYQHLQLRISARCTPASTYGILRMRFNSDTGANYRNHEMYGTGSTVVSGAPGEFNGMDLAIVAGANATAGSYSGIVIDLLDPFETTKYTTARSQMGLVGGFTRVSLQSALWLNTNAVTSITFTENVFGGNYAIGSRFSLYGWKAA